MLFSRFFPNLINPLVLIWVSFTSITHPIQMNPVHSVPRIAWGKYFEENGKIKLPLSVQVHHSLVDGIHVY
ncbi:CatA-like O-acetyltransferase [Clostridium sediminicola]|uniref:CatA-like O-acetyltransferase n=1 Tax=Clostridium sediminicola TaxID=3114879 RepID=UPI003D175631